jgi:predicted lipoprotein with Yx(FWY)xxD motif
MRAPVNLWAHRAVQRYRRRRVCQFNDETRQFVNRRAGRAGLVLLSVSVVAAVGALPAAAASQAGRSPAVGQVHHKRGIEVASRRIKLGRVLTNTKGRVLYVFAKDKPGVSHCSAVCVSAWPRLTTPAKPRAEDGVRAAHLGRTTKGQATYYGHPLYYFSGDTRPREASGQNVGSFFVIAASGKVVRPALKPKRPAGPSTPAVVSTHAVGADTVVTTAAGHTLYELSNEKAGAHPTFYCRAGCVSFWIPLLTKGPPTASGSAVATELGTVKRPDGTTQATCNHHPLYTYVPDASSGVAEGEGFLESAAAGYWYDIAPSGSPIV